MQNLQYHQYLAEAVEFCRNCYYGYFSFGMDLAFTSELLAVAKVLEPNEELELPFDILETMEDPLVRKMHTVAGECGDISNSLGNLNRLTEADIDEGAAGLTKKELKNGIRNSALPTRKQILNVIFKYSCLQAVNMVSLLQDLAILQGYKIKHKRARYFYHNKDLFTNNDDLNIRSLARATELVTELLINLVNVPGFTNKPVLPREARYYPICDWQA